MSDKKITIELTRDEAGDLVGEAQAPYTEARNRIRAALAEHDKKAKRDSLGLPWKALQGGDFWWVGQVIDGGYQTLAADIDNKAQATLMAAAPDLAEALEGLLEWCDAYDRDDRGEVEHAREALKKAGW